MKEQDYIQALKELDKEYEEIFGCKLSVTPEIAFIARKMFEKGKNQEPKDI